MEEADLLQELVLMSTAWTYSRSLAKNAQSFSNTTVCVLGTIKFKQNNIK